MNVTLHPLSGEDLPTMAHIRTAPEQEIFAGTVAEAFAEDPNRFDLHAISHAGTFVGLFKIDRTYRASISIASEAALGLRSFMIDQAHQGQGIATRAVRALAAYLHEQYPDWEYVELTVNHTNAAALACYLKGGFQDTGVDWLEGQAGPQDFLRMELNTDG